MFWSKHKYVFCTIFAAGGLTCDCNTNSLTKECTEAQKKLKDGKLESDKKTFLKAQLPKMEKQIKELKDTLSELLEEDELDPRGEYFLLAEKLIK
eukprot:CAMPEP_0113464880 /NCGR_PEP_ID=MMETSP0014_2-20120614/13438_1 /TAXON_ID=2857 /ORGANISM="Nitzschia sp." /LENGTH=94 /DNA_ID=CAMNT_0000356993 /DNA_START=212 /DNA_END=496 /DNA_ORIENTATION=- /assembly_acc=CAM_ASM_000159